MLKKTINFRLAIICTAAASVGLSMVIISISKLLLVICGLTTLLLAQRTRMPGKPLSGLYTPVAVLAAIFAFALSVLWTVAPLDDALGSAAKYGKLIVIVLMLVLIRDRREAMYATGAFVLAQLFLMASSWLLFFHMPVPWATSNMALATYAVFSSYLDQSIMSAVFAAICWHLRGFAPGRWGRHFAIFFALAALANVFFVLSGRSGHVVAIALLSIAVMWELPRRYRLGAALLPFALLAALSFSSPKVHQRILQAKNEIQSFSFDKGADIAAGSVGSSSGIRLHFWHRAAQSIRDNPVLGSGSGSWASEYNRLEQQQKSKYQAVQGGNPHQEYLLWGVQLGIPGILLIFALMFSILKDSMRMEKPYARATQSALLALAIACLFNASIYDALIGDFFCVLIGLLLALGLSEPRGSAITASQHEQAT